MKKLTIGILAHVDAGKTTLSEGLLYAAGALRTLGRVDHGDAFLDTEALERERGITIFAKQAVLDCGGTHITLLDTPGHVDFSAEAERTLQVLDYAILVISGTDGVQGHTRPLWRLLERYGVPTFLFINKMDLAGADRAALLTDLQKSFGACVDLGAEPNERDEHAALTDEAALEELLERGALSDDTLAALISARKIFPCCFGSALKNEGVEEFLQLLTRFTREPARGADFGARVFKISRDAQGTRLTHLKVTGGTLRAKMQLPCGKADQLRLYSGAKFRPLDAAGAGEVVAVTGLADTYPGQGLGAEADGEKPVLQSVLTYRILLPDGTDAHTVLPKLRELEDEDPMLRISTSSGTRRWARYTSSSWARYSSRCSRACWPSGTGWTWSSTPAAYYIRKPSPRPSRAWAIMSRCATTPRCICCSSPPRAGAVFSLPPPVRRTSWTSTGSVSFSRTLPSARIPAC